MAAKNPVRVSVGPLARPQTSAERLAARTAALAAQQATLKQEAADRRHARDEDPATAPADSPQRTHTGH